MGYRRHISSIEHSRGEVRFDLVVRDEYDEYTYGGGRVTLAENFVEGDLDTAVANIVAQGNSAYPKEHATDALTDEEEQFDVRARALRDVAYRRNTADKPADVRRVRRG